MTVSTLPPEQKTRASWLPETIWTLSACALVAVAALIPLIFNAWFYFYADTPEGAYGQWWALGERLSQGQWPLLEVDAWRAGNWVAEGQWGLWNPLVLLIGLLVYWSPSLLLVTNTIKIVFLAVAAGGVFRAARLYGADRRWAFIGAVAAPFAGFTLFMDATSWVTNLMTWALFPWLLWASQRFASTRRGVAWVFLVGYLLITLGYVQGTIMAVFMFVALLVATAVRRRPQEAIRLLACGVVLGFIAVAVYLPGLLTAGVSSRSSVIANDGFMVYTFTALASSSNPAALADLAGWWGRFPTVPYTYIAWFLPMLALVDVRRLRRIGGRVLGPALFGIIALLYSMAPSLMGPLQFPSRTVPWIAFSVILLSVVALSRARAQPTGMRWILMVAIWFIGAYLSLAQVPSSWRVSLLFSTLTLAALVVAVRLLGREKVWGWGGSAATLVMTATTVGVLLGQSVCFAGNLHSRVDFPDDPEIYEQSMRSGTGDGFIVGVPPIDSNADLDESLIGNFWYLNPTRVHNLYSPVQFRLYSEDLCMAHDGATCAGSLERLFTRDDTTEMPLADLLSIDTVQIVATEDRSLEELRELPVPEGWSLADVGNYSVAWTRNGSQTEPGGVAWTSPGVELEALQLTDENLQFRVVEAPGGGASAVLSRLAWPGYSVDGAAFAEPLRGYLLTVDLSDAQPGDVITVSFQPPGWGVVVPAMIAAAILAALLVVVFTVGARTDSRRLDRKSIRGTEAVR